jgi:hypothetical protein
MMWLWMVLSFVGGIAAFLGALWAIRWWTRGTDQFAWLQRIAGEVPWAPPHDRHMRVHGEGAGGNSHEVYCVPRQEIAECGLKCPKCQAEVAPRADFSKIVRVFIDGQENEVIKCPGVVEMHDGRQAQCPAWLAASPNTEHGDDLIVGDPLSFYQFSRISQQQALREKYGMDVAFELPPDGAGGLVVKAASRPAGVVPVDSAVEKMLGGVQIPFEQVLAQEHARQRAEAAAGGVRATDETALLPTLPPAPAGEADLAGQAEKDSKP